MPAYHNLLALCDRRAEAPDAKVMYITRGYICTQRPDLNDVKLDLTMEHQAGIPRLILW